jgi:hypothetical protein
MVTMGWTPLLCSKPFHPSPTSQLSSSCPSASGKQQSHKPSLAGLTSAEAAQNDASLVAFSEVWVPGYPNFLWSGNFKENTPLVHKYMRNSLRRRQRTRSMSFLDSVSVCRAVCIWLRCLLGQMGMPCCIGGRRSRLTSNGRCLGTLRVIR